MKRRAFMALVGGAAVRPLAMPRSALAQQPAMPVVGFLHTGTPEAFVNLVAAFRKGLSETGHVEGQTVAIEYHWAHNDNKRLPDLAADLVRRKVAVIAAPIGLEAALAAKAATTTIPIVFSIGIDPVQAGLVASINRPGGNATGIANLTAELTGKRLGILHELLPRAARFALLVNPNNPGPTRNAVNDAQPAAAAIGRQIDIVSAGSDRDIDSAFTTLVQARPDALLVNADTLFVARRVQIATLAARHRLPTLYPVREFADAGGLMSYGPSNAVRYRQVGIYAGRILKGEKPADLPVMQATILEFIINLPTARALGLDLPPMLLARADEAIE